MTSPDHRSPTVGPRRRRSSALHHLAVDEHGSQPAAGPSGCVRPAGPRSSGGPRDDARCGRRRAPAPSTIRSTTPAAAPCRATSVAQPGHAAHAAPGRVGRRPGGHRRPGRASAPANWKNLGMPAYTPQGMFPSRRPEPVAAGAGADPARDPGTGVEPLAGHRLRVPGVTGNPLIGNYYGLDSTRHDRRRPGTSGLAQGRLRLRRHTGHRRHARWPDRDARRDRAAAPAARRRARLRGQHRRRPADPAGQMEPDPQRRACIINDGDPAGHRELVLRRVGVQLRVLPASQAATAATGPGASAGRTILPTPATTPNRGFFHENPLDATHPQDWPYPEKVIGFAAFPPALLEAPETHVAAYRAAWWPGDGNAAARNRADAKPPKDLFCVNELLVQPRARHQHRRQSGINRRYLLAQGRDRSVRREVLVQRQRHVEDGLPEHVRDARSSASSSATPTRTTEPPTPRRAQMPACRRAR